jgi:hypothetical protein
VKGLEIGRNAGLRLWARWADMAILLARFTV